MTIVQSESVATGITRIAINRPEKRNAVSPEVRDALIETFSSALKDDEVQAIVLGSTQGHFCAGGDTAILPSNASKDLVRKYLPT